MNNSLNKKCLEVKRKIPIYFLFSIIFLKIKVIQRNILIQWIITKNHSIYIQEYGLKYSSVFVNNVKAYFFAGALQKNPQVECHDCSTVIFQCQRKAQKNKRFSAHYLCCKLYLKFLSFMCFFVFNLFLNLLFTKTLHKHSLN